MSDLTYFIPISYVVNGKVENIPLKVTQFYNPMYKNEKPIDKLTFPDYNSCQQYCIEKGKENEK